MRGEDQDLTDGWTTSSESSDHGWTTSDEDSDGEASESDEGAFIKAEERIMKKGSRRHWWHTQQQMKGSLRPNFLNRRQYSRTMISSMK